MIVRGVGLEGCGVVPDVGEAAFQSCVVHAVVHGDAKCLLSYCDVRTHQLAFVILAPRTVTVLAALLRRARRRQSDSGLASTKHNIYVYDSATPI